MTDNDNENLCSHEPLQIERAMLRLADLTSKLECQTTEIEDRLKSIFVESLVDEKESFVENEEEFCSLALDIHIRCSYLDDIVKRIDCLLNALQL